MSKITSKLQVTIPKQLAEAFALAPGDDIEWAAAGEAIRIWPAKQVRPDAGPAERLRTFDAATDRQRERERGARPVTTARQRGWRRADLYDRGAAR